MKELKLEKETIKVLKEKVLSKPDVLGVCKVCGETDLEYSLSIVDGMYGQAYNSCRLCGTKQQFWIDITNEKVEVDIDDEDFEYFIEERWVVVEHNN